jgi:hypothetical protein
MAWVNGGSFQWIVSSELLAGNFLVAFKDRLRRDAKIPKLTRLLKK